jgi:hypothetical protein
LEEGEEQERREGKIMTEKKRDVSNVFEMGSVKRVSILFWRTVMKLCQVFVTGIGV